MEFSNLNVQQKVPLMQDWVFRLFWAWKIPFIALVGEKMGGREAKLWHHLLFWDERKTLSNVFTSHHFQNDASETQLSAELFDLSEKWKKTYPSQLYLIFYFILLCMVTVKKLRGYLWGSKIAHFSSDCPFKFIYLLSWVLFEVQKHPLIFCLIIIHNHIK